MIADAVGLSAFTVSGVTVALATNPSGLLAVFCGVITATGGGMIRDLLAGVVPAVLRLHLPRTPRSSAEENDYWYTR